MCLGIPGQIIELVDPALQLARVEVAGVKRLVNIACIVDDTHPFETCVGEWVLIHVGFAISRLDAEEAAATLAILQAMAELEDVSAPEEAGTELNPPISVAQV